MGKATRIHVLYPFNSFVIQYQFILYNFEL